DAKAVAGRAEDAALIESVAGGVSGGGFDCVISRAFTELKGFVEMARPYLSEDGTIIAMKGPLEDGASDTTMPLKAELKAVEALGVGSVEVIEVAVPFTDRMTTLVIFRGLSQRDNS
ncbi:MAG: class I SAM-dependent methyltransferase, partial [Deltaproteobacteria bacterium]|nr:class I SAM-dependent methyltransferase [Deltaproteobacteria bacterium]